MTVEPVSSSAEWSRAGAQKRRQAERGTARKRERGRGGKGRGMIIV
jgi:hypothetical protein